MMKAIKYRGNEYQLVQEHVSKDLSVGSLHLVREEHGIVSVLHMTWVHLQWNNSVQLDVNKIHLSLQGVEETLKLLLPTKDDHEEFLHTLNEMEYCPNCNRQAELLAVTFPCEHDDLCSQCMSDEMDDNGIGECDKCRKLDALFAVEDSRIEAYKNLCAGCHGDVTWEVMEESA